MIWILALSLFFFFILYKSFYSINFLWSTFYFFTLTWYILLFYPQVHCFCPLSFLLYFGAHPASFILFSFSFAFFNPGTSVWFFFITMFEMFYLFINFKLIVVHWSIFMMTALKTLSDSFNIWFISMLASVDDLFSPKLWFSWTLMSDF